MNLKDEAKFFKALSDETRLKILLIIRDKISVSANEILKELSITQPTLSYHLKMLHEVGLIDAMERWKWVDYSLGEAGKKKLKQFRDGLMKHDYRLEMPDDED